MNLEIGQCCHLISSLEKQLDWSSPFNIRNESQSKLYEHNLQIHNKRLFKKFTRLKNEQHPLSDISLNDKFIKNVSNINIPKEMMILLSLGPKFALPPNHFPTLNFITDVEYLTQSIEDDNAKKRFRGDMGYTITKFAKSQPKLNRIQKFLLKSTKITNKFLVEHPDIIITNSDKGAVTVISNRSDYHSKITNLLNDLSSFQHLTENPTVACQNKNNRLVTVLCKKSYISPLEAKRLKTYTANPPRLFGQIKVHKENLPVRPIVSTINTAAGKLSRFLANILRKAFPRSKYNLKNSHEFVKKIRDLIVKDRWKMVSFDVVNCFGNIPVDLALEIIDEQFDKICEYTPIPKKVFMNLLKFCLNECNYLVFEGKFYKQIDGMFMGSSLAPILVELVLERAIDKTIEQLDFIPEIWTIYVDDIFTVIPEDKIVSALNILNSFHPKVKFTVEIEEDRSIHFLDTTVFKNDLGKIKTSWYSKPIASNRIINYYSSHPRYMIENVSKALIKRALSLSHRDFHVNVLEKIKKILALNNFPKHRIKKLIVISQQKRKLKSLRSTNNSQINQSHNVLKEDNSYPFLDLTECSIISKNQVEAPKCYRGMTYIPNLTEMVSKTITKYDPRIKIAPRPPYKLQNMFTRTKDKIPKMNRSGVVYDIPCKSCEKRYIGETIQKLKERVRQHQRTCESSNHKNPTALTKHSLDLKHLFDFDQVKILAYEKNKQKLRIQEVNQIIVNEETCCNYKTDSQHITPAFYNLIKEYKPYSPFK